MAGATLCREETAGNRECKDHGQQEEEAGEETDGKPDRTAGGEQSPMETAGVKNHSHGVLRTRQNLIPQSTKTSQDQTEERSADRTRHEVALAHKGGCDAGLGNLNHFLHGKAEFFGFSGNESSGERTD